MSSLPRALAVLGIAGLLSFSGAMSPASAQAYLPAASLHPVLLEEVVDYEAILVQVSPTFDVLSSDFPSDDVRRHGAYADFERALTNRCRGIVGDGHSRDQRRAAKQRLLAGIGDKLAGVPGASFVHQGSLVWRQIERSTNFNLDGFRVRLRVDEAVEGRLALKVQKKLR